MESLKQNWYFIVILAVLLVAMILIWRQAIKASRRTHGERAKLMSKIDRLKALSEKYKTLNAEVMNEVPDCDLIDAAMIHIWRKLGSEKEEVENFKRLSLCEKNIYTAWYIREEATNDDIAAFYRNCGHVLSEFSGEVFSQISIPALLPVMKKANEMFDENTDVSCDKASKERIDKEFKAAFNEAEFESATAKYIRDNPDDFIYSENAQNSDDA